MSKEHTPRSQRRSLIDVIDTLILKYNTKLADKWTNITHESPEKLEKTLYRGGASTLGIYGVATGEYFFVLPGVVSALQGIFIPTNSKDIKDLNERYKSFNQMDKFMRVSVYGTGMTGTLLGAGNMVAGVINNNAEQFYDAFRQFTRGAGLLSWMSAEYLTRARVMETEAQKVDEISMYR